MTDRERELRQALEARDWARAARLALRYSREDEAQGLKDTAKVWTRLGVECWAQTQTDFIVNERGGK